MNSRNKKLGMGNTISRRDLIHGIAATTLAVPMAQSGIGRAVAAGTQTALTNYAGIITDAAAYPPA